MYCGTCGSPILFSPLTRLIVSMIAMLDIVRVHMTRRTFLFLSFWLFRSFNFHLGEFQRSDGQSIYALRSSAGSASTSTNERLMSDNATEARFSKASWNAHARAIFLFLFLSSTFSHVLPPYAGFILLLNTFAFTVSMYSCEFESVFLL